MRGGRVVGLCENLTRTYRPGLPKRARQDRLNFSHKCFCDQIDNGEVGRWNPKAVPASPRLPKFGLALSALCGVGRPWR